MPDFERVKRSFERHLAKDDPVRLAYLKGKYETEDKCRKQIALIALVAALGYVIAFFADQVDAYDCQDTFLGCETIVIDEDGPDQDPVYDEDDPVYDEMDDYEDGSDD